MQNAKIKNYIHLHFLVFIAGFTAILGELITIEAIPLVWYRMLIAGILIFIYLKFKKINLSVTNDSLKSFFIAGIVIALHWITFFAAIKVSNISITLAMFSSGAFFASLIEPLFYKRKIIIYELVFGFIIIVGVAIIVQAELKNILGIILGILSALFSTIFAVLNGKLVKFNSSSVITLYEFVSGVFFISIFLFLNGDLFQSSMFKLSINDILYLIILSSICTAYAFIASVYVMRYLSPYTVILSYNLEPIYGILLAIIFFPSSELMSSAFYFGAFIIISTVIANAILKFKYFKN
tara:strand:+ start:29138 stop:30022 length:885 start_codon:yes stop_codon:yes gene_type:complete